MSNTIIKLEPVLSWVEANISKQYRLGQVGIWWLIRSLSLSKRSKSTLRGDFQSCRLSCVEAWWHSIRGKEDPTLKIGQTNQLNHQLLSCEAKSSINNNRSAYRVQFDENFFVTLLKRQICNI